MISTLATIMLVASFITGAMSPQDCPTNAVWQWYEAHGIWACGGER